MKKKDKMLEIGHSFKDKKLNNNIKLIHSSENLIFIN